MHEVGARLTYFCAIEEESNVLGCDVRPSLFEAVTNRFDARRMTCLAKLRAPLYIRINFVAWAIGEISLRSC